MDQEMVSKDLLEIIDGHISDTLADDNIFISYYVSNEANTIGKLKKQMTLDIIHKGGQYQMYQFSLGKDIDEVIDFDERVIYKVLGDYEDELKKIIKIVIDRQTLSDRHRYTRSL